jgi:hypothetical protein
MTLPRQVVRGRDYMVVRRPLRPSVTLIGHGVAPICQDDRGTPEAGATEPALESNRYPILQTPLLEGREFLVLFQNDEIRAGLVQ